jgi:hypothetical protein
MSVASPEVFLGVEAPGKLPRRVPVSGTGRNGKTRHREPLSRAGTEYSLYVLNELTARRVIL